MQTDMLIPRLTDIIDRAIDCRESAKRLNDTAAYDQFTRLICALYDSPRMAWQLGTLIVRSPSGHTYHVTNAGCDCENARKCSKRQCWHLLCRGVLEDMFATECDTADMLSEPPTFDDPLPDPGPGGPGVPGDERPWYTRMATARRLAWASGF